MGLFSAPFDVEVDKATSETNTGESWDVIMEICDKAAASPKNCRDCLRSIVRRMQHSDPHVVLQAITLLDACVNNCGHNFRLEIASRQFEADYVRLIKASQPKVALKLRLLLKKWADGEFKQDPLLNLIPSLYHKLSGEGYDFTDAAGAAAAKQKQQAAAAAAAASRDPNVVSSQKEQDDIAKAIELSLKETTAGGSKASSTSANASSGSSSNPYASLYSQVASHAPVTSTTAVKSPAPAVAEARKVRALYDFEAAEDNELTFLAGEIIHVTDDSDPNWWKGYNQRGDGLFPSNFVTADLSAEVVPEETASASAAAAQSDAEIEALAAQTAAATLADAIDEERIDRLLHLLSEANPEDPTHDSAEMLQLEQQVERMQPLIDAELERVDRKHAQLTKLSSDLVDAINLYHMLMREPQAPTPYGAAPAGVYGANPYGQMPGQMPPTSMMSMAPVPGHFVPQMMGQLPPHSSLHSLPHQHLPHAMQQQGVGILPQQQQPQHPQHQQHLHNPYAPPDMQQQQQHQQQLGAQDPYGGAAAQQQPMTTAVNPSLMMPPHTTVAGASLHHPNMMAPNQMQPYPSTTTVAGVPNGLGGPNQAQPPMHQQQPFSNGIQAPQAPQPHHQHQPQLNGGGAAYYSQPFAPQQQPQQQQPQPQLPQHSIYQQPQHPYPAVTQPITNTILPPSADQCANIPMYQPQQQR